VPWAGQRVPSAGEVGGVVPAGVTPQSPVQRCTAPLPIRGKSRARTRELHGLPSASRSPKEKSSGGYIPPRALSAIVRPQHQHLRSLTGSIVPHYLRCLHTLGVVVDFLAMKDVTER